MEELIKKIRKVLNREDLYDYTVFEVRDEIIRLLEEAEEKKKREDNRPGGYWAQRQDPW